MFFCYLAKNPPSPIFKAFKKAEMRVLFPYVLIITAKTKGNEF